MKKDYVWCDINKNEYELKDIDDRYLFNILRFISNGGGYTEFLDDTKIEKLFNEAKKRNIKHNFTIEQLIDAFHEKLSYECQENWWEEKWWDYID